MDPWTSTISALVVLVFDLMCTVHVLWTRSDSRSSLAWIGMVWTVPALGALLYMMFGVNRIKRKASRVRQAREPFRRGTEVEASEQTVASMPTAFQLHQLRRALDTVSEQPIVLGNEVTPLRDGDEAYPAMIEAIDGAKSAIAMQSYIFEIKGPGREIVAALVRAHKRGVQVRVLVDAAGERYGYPRTTRILKREGVPCGRFMPAFPPWRWPYVNLRNHRKLLVVDGETAFTGGINIRPGHLIESVTEHPTHDLHFRLHGPVAAQLMQVFAEDWYFVTKEHLDGPPFFAEAQIAPGTVPARAVADGPDEDFDKVRWAFLSALACAQKHILIATPYFLPDDALVMALGVAARKGVQVDVILPEKGNLAIVDWAMAHLLGNVDLRGVKIWRTPGTFDHSKLMVVDNAWVFLGSSNWDARSLRLNFELNVECYSEHLGKQMVDMLQARIDRSHEDKRRPTSFFPRMRNAVAALFTPYL